MYINGPSFISVLSSEVRPPPRPSRMAMGVRHAEPPDGVTLEVEFDQHHRLAAHDPAVVARLDRHDLRSLVLHDTAVGAFDVSPSMRQESGVGVHAQLGPDDRFHVDRPAEPAWIDQALDTRCAGTADVEPDMADGTALGS